MEFQPSWGPCTLSLELCQVLRDLRSICLHSITYQGRSFLNMFIFNCQEYCCYAVPPSWPSGLLSLNIFQLTLDHLTFRNPSNFAGSCCFLRTMNELFCFFCHSWVTGFLKLIGFVHCCYTGPWLKWPVHRQYLFSPSQLKNLYFVQE